MHMPYGWHQQLPSCASKSSGRQSALLVKASLCCNFSIIKQVLCLQEAFDADRVGRCIQVVHNHFCAFKRLSLRRVSVCDNTSHARVHCSLQQTVRVCRGTGSRQHMYMLPAACICARWIVAACQVCCHMSHMVAGVLISRCLQEYRMRKVVGDFRCFLSQFLQNAH